MCSEIQIEETGEIKEKNTKAKLYKRKWKWKKGKINETCAEIVKPGKCEREREMKKITQYKISKITAND